jgi:hypothetical protein
MNTAFLVCRVSQDAIRDITRRARMVFGMPEYCSKTSRNGQQGLGAVLFRCSCLSFV